MSKPDFVELDRIGDCCSNRWGARISNILLHTQEGDGSAESLASYLNNENNGASYHYTIRDGVVCDVVDTDFASWSVLDANPYTINMCFAGSFASWSRQQWLERDNDLRIAAYLAVEDGRKYSIPLDVIAPPYQRRDGITDHRYVTECLGIGTHTDVGDSFPWDVFSKYVREAAEAHPDNPVINQIDVAASAAPWLGKRCTEGEAVCGDGVGRCVQFEHGSIYWNPRVGAHPIPESLWQKFTELNRECGPLGYPVTDHVDLKSPDARVAGVVQGFENGAIYRQVKQPAFWVHGDIRERWNRSGFENGPYGWPTSDETPSGPGVYQDFEHGRMYWPDRQQSASS
ncbi:N-acetylmuramoyl-L-alanine amidase [Nocardia brasiliensis]|uniref:N-acetylmuramoyl-L-alanine amidase n=1 Tax=Nocardia brasiliensis TaxID=37326 RepID=UPI0024551014|nr:N-acetylmuramoyl-L-alanine amidase [Nocardia brasiliensis]